jgi:ABC-type transport system substrate-binding protein
MRLLRLAAIAATALLATNAVPAQTTLRVGLAEDPDILDPTLARTYVGRIVFAALCDKLFDIDEKLNIVPQLGDRSRLRHSAPVGCLPVLHPGWRGPVRVEAMPPHR